MSWDYLSYDCVGRLLQALPHPDLTKTMLMWNECRGRVLRSVLRRYDGLTTLFEYLGSDFLLRKKIFPHSKRALGLYAVLKVSLELFETMNCISEC